MPMLTVQEGDKLFAAITPKAIGAAQGRGCVLNDTDNHPIAHLMSIVVIHLLEVIDVHNQ